MSAPTTAMHIVSVTVSLDGREHTFEFVRPDELSAVETAEAITKGATPVAVTTRLAEPIEEMAAR